jgi:RNA polymerase sigma factor, sigma-70 family
MKEISFRQDILPMKNELYRLALRITLNREEAEDIVQETMMKVWNKRNDWDRIENIEAFCLTVCRNLALDANKRNEKRNGKSTGQTFSEGGNYNGNLTSLSSQNSIEDTPDREQTPYEKMMQQDRISLVRNLINELPEKQRSCMQLRDIEGKAYKEIAAILDITEEQVKVNIFRARQTIKQQYQKYEQYGL